MAAFDTTEDKLITLKPDTEVSVRETFGIDLDGTVPAFSERDPHVPDIDPAYKFDPETTRAIIAGFAHGLLDGRLLCRRLCLRLGLIQRVRQLPGSLRKLRGLLSRLLCLLVSRLRLLRCGGCRLAGIGRFRLLLGRLRRLLEFVCRIVQVRCRLLQRCDLLLHLLRELVGRLGKILRNILRRVGKFLPGIGEFRFRGRSRLLRQCRQVFARQLLRFRRKLFGLRDGR